MKTSRSSQEVAGKAPLPKGVRVLAGVGAVLFGLGAVGILKASHDHNQWATALATQLDIGDELLAKQANPLIGDALEVAVAEQNGETTATLVRGSLSYITGTGREVEQLCLDGLNAINEPGNFVATAQAEAACEDLGQTRDDYLKARAEEEALAPTEGDRWLVAGSVLTVFGGALAYSPAFLINQRDRY